MRAIEVHRLSKAFLVNRKAAGFRGSLRALVRPQMQAVEALRFVLGLVFVMAVFLGFMVLVQSLAFWMGHAGLVGSQAMNAIVSFALYPLDLFDGTAKLVLFTVLPAAYMGAVRLSSCAASPGRAWPNSPARRWSSCSWAWRPFTGACAATRAAAPSRWRCERLQERGSPPCVGSRPNLDELGAIENVGTQEFSSISSIKGRVKRWIS